MIRGGDGVWGRRNMYCSLSIRIESGHSLNVKPSCRIHANLYLSSSRYDTLSANTVHHNKPAT